MKKILIVLAIVSISFYIWTLFPSGKIASVPLVGDKLHGYYLVYKSKITTNINDKNRLYAIGNALINNQSTFEYTVPNFQMNR